MNKGLKALDVVIDTINVARLNHKIINESKIDGCLNTIEKELKDYYELLENERSYVPHSSSTALHGLHVLALKNTDRRYWFLPRKLANTIDKELKALESIKELFDIKVFETDRKYFITFMTTNRVIRYHCTEEIKNKEEYVLLKEVLGNYE